MKAIVLETMGGLDSLQVKDRPRPAPGPGQVLVRVRAAALNYRDLLVVEGGYGSKQKSSDLIPLCDGAGEVAELGPGAHRFKVGDRVTASVFPAWPAGEPTQERLDHNLGGSLDGLLCEYRALDEAGLVATPAHLSDVEAAACPCAGVTAWSAIVTQGRTAPGDVVLAQGTGGVSLFALQFARLCGAEVIATSSSDDKLARARELGAAHGINYRNDPEWGRTALAITGGRGVDNVIEVGGAGTLKQSMRAVRPGGTISLIGVLAGARHELLIPPIVMRNVRVQGVTCGSVEGLAAMFRGMATAGLKPVVDRVFPFDEARQAWEYLASGRHMGKIVIEL